LLVLVEGSNFDARGSNRRVPRVARLSEKRDPPQLGKAPPSYTYKQINPDPSQDYIRLLRPFRDSHGRLCGELRTFPVSQCPTFIAVSYTWEPVNPVQQIIISGQILDIGRNIFQALDTYTSYDTLRSLDTFIENESSLSSAERRQFMLNPERWTYFWIDSICIDQSNVRERNHQIKMMKSIYTRAAFTLAWLGDEVENSNSTSLGARPLMEVMNLPGKEWRRISKDVRNRRYRTRLWIVQEVVLAKDILICCGKDHICWSDPAWLHISNSATGFVPKTHAPKAKGSQQLFQLFKQKSIISLHDMRRNQDKLEDLEVLILKFIDQECHDPRDKIYGLLSLANCRGSRDIEVDYTKTNKQVYDEVMEIVWDSTSLTLPWKRQHFARKLLNGVNLNHLVSETLEDPRFSSYPRYFT